MKTIFKYETLVNDKFTISMPKHAKILSVQESLSNGVPCIWAMVDTENEKEERTFELFGTGSEILDRCSLRNYIGTYQLNNGSFVGHLFELRNDK
jgi:hypothetical protein